MTRPMVTIGISFLAAGLLAVFLPVWGMAALLLFLIAGGLVLVILRKRLSRTHLRMAAVLLCGAAAGILLQIGDAAAHSFDFSTLAGQKALLTGRVQEIVRQEKYSAHTLQVTENAFPNAPQSFRAILYLPAEERVEIGDEITITSTVLQSSATVDFDMAEYDRSMGISLRMISHETPTLHSGTRRTLREGLAAYNGYLREWVDEQLAPPYNGMVKALLLGDTSSLDEHTEGILQYAGVRHIVSISGLHISLMSGALLLLLRKCRVPRRWAAVFACLAAWLFVLFSGGNPPALRAGIMLTILLAGSLFHRPADSLNSLFLAAVILVLLSPSVIRSGSLWLTLTATFGAIVLAPPLERRLCGWLHIRGGIGRAILSLLSMSIGCSGAMLPVLLVLYGGISLIAPLVNLAAVPLLTPLLVLSFLFAAASFLPIGNIISPLLKALIDLLLGICEGAAKLPFGYLGLDHPLTYGLCLAAFVLVGGGWLLTRKTRVVLRLGILFLTLLTGLLCTQSVLLRDTVRITPVSSFSSTALVLEHRGSATIIAFADDDSTGEYLRDFLWRRNIRRIDNLILAVGNTDHANDEIRLSEFFPVGNLYLRPGNEWTAYAEALLQPENGLFLLEEGRSYLLDVPDGMELSLQTEEDGVLLALSYDGGTIRITDSRRAAAGECEILIFQGNFLEIQEQVSSKYDILLAEPEKETAALLPDVIWACRERVELRASADGCRLER